MHMLTIAPTEYGRPRAEVIDEAMTFILVTREVEEEIQEPTDGGEDDDLHHSHGRRPEQRVVQVNVIHVL